MVQRVFKIINLKGKQATLVFHALHLTCQVKVMTGFFYQSKDCFLFWTSNCVSYRVSQEECARLREGVPYVKVYRYNPKHLCPKLNGYGDNGQRSLKL